MGSIYPISLNLKDRKCVVMGGGPVARRKVEGLKEAGADITLISPRLEDSLKRVADRGDLHWEPRTFEPGDLEGATAQIQVLHAAHAFDAVVAVDDAGTRLAARASAMLGLAANPEESVVSAANKQVFREVCAAAGLASPWFKEISLTADPSPLA